MGTSKQRYQLHRNLHCFTKCSLDVSKRKLNTSTSSIDTPLSPDSESSAVATMIMQTNADAIQSTTANNSSSTEFTIPTTLSTSVDIGVPTATEHVQLAPDLTVHQVADCIEEVIKYFCSMSKFVFF